MKALSIKQPWAWAIVHAGKRVENREWRCYYRGPILIHASKLPTRKTRVPPAFQADFDAMRDMADDAGADLSRCLPASYKHFVLQSGAIVGRARIVDCVECSGSPWFVGPYGIVLADVQPTAIVPCKGQLGLWDVPPDVVRHVRVMP